MEKHIIQHNFTLLDALTRLNDLSGGAMTLFVTDNEGHMEGTLTDGDIRRGILAGCSLSDPVSTVMHRDFSALRGETIDIDAMRQCRMRGVRLLPQLDEDGKILRTIDLSLTPVILPVSAILMAGGKGERLRPLTLTCPKPLLKIGGKPIIDYNVGLLARAGINRITVTTNYLSEQLYEHFSQPVEGVKVECVKEEKPLGTLGSVTLIDHEPGGTTIVMNSDLLTTISFEDMYLQHKTSKASITIAAIPYNLSVPYAILTTDGRQVTALEEKPSYSYYANAGIYMISNDLLVSLPEDQRIDATDLIEQAIADGLKVDYFPIDGTWIDIGSPTDFNHACELMKHRERFNI